MDAFPSLFTIGGYFAVTASIYQYNTATILKNSDGEKEINEEDDEERLRAHIEMLEDKVSALRKNADMVG